MPSSDYTKFYTCPNKPILDTKPGWPEGYITKDGMWAAIPSTGSKFVIVNNGEIVHVSRNYPSAKAYILKNKNKKKNVK